MDLSFLHHPALLAVLNPIVATIGPKATVYASIGALATLVCIPFLLKIKSKRKQARNEANLHAKAKEAGLLAFGDEFESNYSKETTKQPIFDRGHTSPIRASQLRETEVKSSSDENVQQYLDFFRKLTSELADNDLNLKHIKPLLSQELYDAVLALNLLRADGVTPKKFTDVSCTVQSSHQGHTHVLFTAQSVKYGTLQQIWVLEKKPLLKNLILQNIHPL